MNAKPKAAARRAPKRRMIADDSLLAVCRAMGSNLELGKLLETILELSMGEVGAQEASILLYEKGGDQLKMLASKGLPEEVAGRGYLPRKGSIAEWVIDNDKPLILNGAVSEKKYTSASGGRTIVSSMCVPLRARGETLGTINLNRTDAAMEPFGKRELGAMTILASQAAASIENSRLYEANLQSERLAAMGQTVAGVAHCVKNMLTSLRGGLSVCQKARTVGDWALQDEGIEVLDRSIKRVSSLALDMLDFSKSRDFHGESVDLAEMIRELIGLKTQAARERDVRLVGGAEPGAEIAWGDGQQLFRCVLNLVENALDASAFGGEISIRASRDGSAEALRRLSHPATEATILRVSDRGEGIKPEVCARIFDPFFSTKGSKGTGLGLAVTRKIILDHGGEIEASSKPDEGAVFTIYLPAPPQ